MLRQRRVIFTSIRTVFRLGMSSCSSIAGEEAGPPPLKKLRADDELDGEGEGVGHDVDVPEEGQSSSGPAQECDVGITEFASDHEGFFAILKRRYAHLSATPPSPLNLISYPPLSSHFFSPVPPPFPKLPPPSSPPFPFSLIP